MSQYDRNYVGSHNVLLLLSRLIDKNGKNVRAGSMTEKWLYIKFWWVMTHYVITCVWTADTNDMNNVYCRFNTWSYWNSLHKKSKFIYQLQVTTKLQPLPICLTVKLLDSLCTNYHLSTLYVLITKGDVQYISIPKSPSCCPYFPEYGGDIIILT